MMRTHSGSLGNRAISGLTWLLFANAGQAIAQFIVLIVLARLLSPSDFGQLAACSLVTTGLITLASLGVGPALVQRAAITDKDVATAFTLCLILSATLAGAVALAAKPISSFIGATQLASILRVLALSFILRGAAITAEFVLRRQLRFRELSLTTNISYLAGYAVPAIGLAMLGFGVWSLVVGQLGQLTLRLLMLARLRVHSLRLSFDQEARRQLLNFGVGHSLSRIVADLTNQTDYFVVSRWLGLEALGIYERAFQLMSNAGKLFGDSINTVLFPTMATVQSDRTRLTRAYVKASSVALLVSIPATAAIASLAPEFIALTLGDRWNEAVLPFQVLALAVAFRSAASIGDALIAAVGAVYLRLARRVVTALVTFVLCWIGVRYGIGGVAAGTLAAIAFDFVLMTASSLRYVDVKWPEFLRAHASALAQGFAVAMICILGAWVFRGMQLPAAVTLLLGGVTALGAACLLGLIVPNLFLGTHGIWARDMIRSRLSGRL